MDSGRTSMYKYLKHTILRPTYREFFMNIVKDPLRRAIILASSKIPIPTKENTAHPNSHILIDLRDLFMAYEDNPRRDKMFLAAWNILIAEYEHDVYYRERLNWVLKKIKGSAWEDNWIKRPHTAHWREHRGESVEVKEIKGEWKPPSLEPTFIDKLKLWYNIHIFGFFTLRLIKEAKTILELGSGKESLVIKSGLVHKAEVTAVDRFFPYIRETKSVYHSALCMDITEMEVEDVSDAVLCMDVLEHIEREKVIESNLLGNMKKWGRKVVITTPNGFVDNDRSDDNVYQDHLSGWTVDDFKKHGYKVRGISGWKFLRKEGDAIRFKPILLWAFISLLTIPLFYFIPSHSWHLLAYSDSQTIQKEISNGNRCLRYASQKG